MNSQLIASFAGKASALLFVWMFTPLYVKFLGIEAFGLVGFYNCLYSFTNLADFGLSGSLNRELAILSVTDRSSRRARNLVRTLELVFAAIALALVAAVTLLAPWIVNHGVKPGTLSHAEVCRAMQLMAITLGLQFLAGLPTGGLVGLQQQVRLNVAVATIGALRGVGAIVALSAIGPAIHVYFGWQIAINIVQVVMLRALLWRALPPGAKPRFDLTVFKAVWPYARGITFIGITTTVLMQTDKIVLSRLLSLEWLGFYTLAWTIGSVPNLALAPAQATFLPRLSQCVAAGRIAELSGLYHRACQFVSVMVLPLVWVVALFSKELTGFWIRNPNTVERVYPLARLLVIGFGLMALTGMPYTLQLAHAWTSLTLRVNLVAIPVFVPLLIICVRRYGAAGACGVLIMLSAAYFLVSMQLMYRRILPLEKWRWYWNDIGIPLVSAGCVAIAGRVLIPHFATAGLGAMFAVVVWCCAVAAAALAAAELRLSLKSQWRSGWMGWAPAAQPQSSHVQR